MKFGQKFSFLGALVFAVMLSSVASAKVYYKGKAYPDGSVVYQGRVFEKSSLEFDANGQVTGYASGKNALVALTGEDMLFDFSQLFSTEALTNLQGTVVAIIMSLVGIAMVVLIGRAVLRALQIRP